MKSFFGILFALALLLPLLAIALPTPVLAASDVWVDDTGPSCPGIGSGTQADPYCKIQDGIDNVVSPGTVHVAPGTYDENITLKDGVEVMGAGADVTTIDGGGSGSVVYCSGVGSTTRLDGFTITNGSYPLGAGGGMRNVASSSPMVTNCIFSGNSARDGGGMYNTGSSSPTVDNCIFSGNSASFGGGMYNSVSSPMVTNCTFSGNSASDGGGMYHNSCSPMVKNCIFSGNSAHYGGGMFIYDNSSPTVENCIFSGNSANYSGGGIYNEYYSSPTVTNCDFVGNSATSGSGGGMYIYDSCSSPVIHNNIIVGNTASMGGGIWSDGTSWPTIDYNDVWNNSPNDYSGCSAGPHDISYDPVFVNPAMGDYHLQSSSPCIDTGTNVGAPTEDIEGNPRPIDGHADGTATTDMGAFEYVPLPPPVGGEAYPVSKSSLLASWIVVGLVLAGGTSWYVLMRRRAQS